MDMENSIPSMRKLVNIYLEQRCAKQKPASFIDYLDWYQKQYPDGGSPGAKKSYERYQSEWGLSENRTSEEKDWYNYLRHPTILTGANYIIEFLNIQSTAHKTGTYDEFWMWCKVNHPEYKHIVGMRQFADISTNWNKGEEKSQAQHDWFNTIRLGPRANAIILSYLDESCKGNRPANYKDFLGWLKSQHPDVDIKIPLATFGTSLFHWIRDPVRTQTDRVWYESYRYGEPGPKEFVSEYCKQQSNSNKIANYEDIHRWINDNHPEITRTMPKASFDSAAYRWGTSPDRTQAEKIWYETTRVGEPTTNFNYPYITEALGKYNVQRCRENSPASFQDFLEWVTTQYPGYPYKITQDTYHGETHAWNKSNERTLEEHNWFNTTRVEESRDGRAPKIGQAFEKSIFAEIFSTLKTRGVTFYHQTPNYSELGMVENAITQNQKRVEGRLFTSNLLNPASGVGFSFRDFLEVSGRRHVAVDFTLSTNYGGKITKYVDPATSLIIVTLNGAVGQRVLDAHVRALSVKEFTGPGWLNLNPTACERIQSIVEQVHGALRYGLKSPEYTDLKISADRKWVEIQEDIRSSATRVQYLVKVHREIEADLRNGRDSPEIQAYIQNLRKNSHGEKADEVQKKLDLILALGKGMERIRQLGRLKESAGDKKITQKLPDLPPDFPRYEKVPENPNDNPSNFPREERNNDERKVKLLQRSIPIESLPKSSEATTYSGVTRKKIESVESQKRKEYYPSRRWA